MPWISWDLDVATHYMVAINRYHLLSHSSQKLITLEPSLCLVCGQIPSSCMTHLRLLQTEGTCLLTRTCEIVRPSAQYCFFSRVCSSNRRRLGYHRIIIYLSLQRIKSLSAIRYMMKSTKIAFINVSINTHFHQRKDIISSIQSRLTTTKKHATLSNHVVYPRLSDDLVPCHGLGLQ